MKITIVGAGSMGHGISQLFATNGFEVILVDVNAAILQKAKKAIRLSLIKFANKKRIQEEKIGEILGRINFTTNFKMAVKKVDLIVEAIPEDLDLKKKFFKTIDSIVTTDPIYASNTSTLSITDMSKSIKNPEKFVGMHFFNPPQLSYLIEIVKGNKTSQKTIDKVTKIVKTIGKTPIIVQKDMSGFVVNRILGMVINEAFWTYYRGETTREGVDASVKYSGGFPMGWFELVDFIGLDLTYTVGQILFETYGERFRPCTAILLPLLKEKKLGKKTGIGFYNWSNGRPRIPFNLLDEYDVDRSWAVALNETAWIIQDNVASIEDIDKGMKLGAFWPSGPFEYADKIGIDNLTFKLRKLYEKNKMDMYKPCPLIEELLNKSFITKNLKEGFTDAI